MTTPPSLALPARPGCTGLLLFLAIDAVIVVVALWFLIPEFPAWVRGESVASTAAADSSEPGLAPPAAAHDELDPATAAMVAEHAAAMAAAEAAARPPLPLFVRDCWRGLIESRVPRGRLLRLDYDDSDGRVCAALVETDEGSGQWMRYERSEDTADRAARVQPLPGAWRGADPSVPGHAEQWAWIERALAVLPWPQTEERPLRMVYAALPEGPVLGWSLGQVVESGGEPAWQWFGTEGALPDTRQAALEARRGEFAESLPQSFVQLDPARPLEAPEPTVEAYAALADACAYWLDLINGGALVWRMTIAGEDCQVVLQTGNFERFYRFDVQSIEAFGEGEYVAIAGPLPNLALDRAELAAPRVRAHIDGAARALALPPSRIRSIAAQYLGPPHHTAVWQLGFADDAGRLRLQYLDAQGAAIPAPADYPILASDSARGFIDSGTVIEYAAEMSTPAEAPE